MIHEPSQAYKDCMSKIRDAKNKADKKALIRYRIQIACVIFGGFCTFVLLVISLK